MIIEKGELNGGRFNIPYRVYGDADPSMVCVSGAQQTMAVWRSFVNYFSKDYSIATFDMPGLGRSKILDGPMELSLDEQIEILARIIKTTQRPGPLTLVGASWGTIVVAAYAAHYPEEVKELVLGSFGVKPCDSMMEVIKEGQKLYKLGAKTAVAHLFIERFGQNINDGYKQKIIAQFTRMTQDQALAFYNHCGFVESVQHIEEYISLDKITARTLIVNGANDTILDLEDVQIAHAKIPNCQTRIVEDAGHFLHFERPDILDIYAEFLSTSV